MKDESFGGALEELKQELQKRVDIEPPFEEYSCIGCGYISPKKVSNCPRCSSEMKVIHSKPEFDTGRTDKDQ